MSGTIERDVNVLSRNGIILDHLYSEKTICAFCCIRVANILFGKIFHARKLLNHHHKVNAPILNKILSHCYHYSFIMHVIIAYLLVMSQRRHRNLFVTDVYTIGRNNLEIFKQLKFFNTRTFFVTISNSFVAVLTDIFVMITFLALHR